MLDIKEKKIKFQTLVLVFIVENGTVNNIIKDNPINIIPASLPGVTLNIV